MRCSRKEGEAQPCWTGDLDNRSMAGFSEREAWSPAD